MPSDAKTHPSLIRAEPVQSRPGDHRSWTLPPDLLREAVQRLRASALLYACAYFLAGFLPALLLAEGRAMFFSSPAHWLPVFLSIAGGLALAGLVSYPGLSDRAKVRAGLIFEVLGSIGIAAAEYQHVTAPIQVMEGQSGFGLSWVAAWVLLFSVVVPTPPRVTVVSAAFSVATVPLVYAVGVALGSNAALPPAQFFFSLVFPYLVIVLMAYVGSRVVYGLGTEVRKAREMGSYRLVKRLGEGGMGEVWLAQHRMLARPAAIKLIRPEVLGVADVQSRQLLKRFEREAQATALMRSPHTLALYDFGMADDGTFYYVMELLDGFDLDDLIERFGPVPAERAVHFLRQTCASLAEAHDAGLIHRDIKPANLYTCRYGRDVDFIKVLDFGLVKQNDAAGPGADKLTVEHFAGGTPAFMSPEQAVGEEGIDGRSDLYSLGCVAYWLLTGTPVFKGRTPIETMMMHVHVKPEPPSLYTKIAIPPELEAIVMSCLSKDAEARPQTADELAARLSGIRMGSDWTQRRAREWWDANRPGPARISIPV
jgi:serine/threonine-protein kinase